MPALQIVIVAGPDTTLAWLLYVLLAVGVLTVAVGVRAGRGKREGKGVRARERVKEAARAGRTLVYVKRVKR